MEANQKINSSTLIAFVVVSVAVVGFFVGLQSPMNPLTSEATSRPIVPKPERSPGATILATSYADMHNVTQARTSKLRTSLKELSTADDVMSELMTQQPAETRVEPTPEARLAHVLFALNQRDANRAFNGAPPTVPHPIDQKSAAACMACHGKGVKTESLRIPRMSHRFLANCTQCHVEDSPTHMDAELFRESHFTGLAAPTEGPRAFPGAPPQIPHTTWMRSDCMSCHGLAGRQAIRTTHPWRRNCQQCHAPSSTLDQTLLHSEPEFLPPPKIEAKSP